MRSFKATWNQSSQIYPPGNRKNSQGTVTTKPPSAFSFSTVYLTVEDAQPPAPRLLRPTHVGMVLCTLATPHRPAAAGVAHRKMSLTLTPSKRVHSQCLAICFVFAYQAVVCQRLFVTWYNRWQVKRQSPPRCHYRHQVQLSSWPIAHMINATADVCCEFCRAGVPFARS